MNTKDTLKLNRRKMLAAATAAGVGMTLSSVAAEAEEHWDHDTDVVCVGGGAASCSAAIAALDAGARVMLLEKLPLLGGTTAKSAGVVWVPNNFVLRQNGVEDRKEDAMKYMARYSYPLEYNPGSPTLGLTPFNYALIEAFYDNAAKTIDRLQELGVVKFREFRLWQVDQPCPDYADHLPENKTPVGRSLESAVGWGPGGGASLAGQLEAWLRAKKVPILTKTRVTRLVVRDGRVIGIEADSKGKPLRIRARRGVVFGTGGYAQNTELVERHQIALYGACAGPGATGDFIGIAQEAGAKMGALGTAWRSPVLLEEALQNRVLGIGAFWMPGDSMILVNKYGKRCVDEKRPYNVRTQAHFHYDSTREEYPNHLMFMLFDQRTLDAFGGDLPLPPWQTEHPYLLRGESWEALASALSAKLQSLEGKTGGVKLSADFADSLAATIAGFNDYATKGKDPEFGRGNQLYDRRWHLMVSARRQGTTQPENPYPNITMHPFEKKGPYYAFILAPGALDTSGGPLINEKAQVLAHDDAPIPGLYGAGNCIAAPSRGAYYGAGGTIGPALTFGAIAGRNAARDLPA